METGELKSVVIQCLRMLDEASVNDIIKFISSEYDREYAYSTIATVLTRLEQEKIVKSEKKRKVKRKKTYYQLVETAHKEEASAFLKDYVSKFGEVGIRHLGEVMGADISKHELEELRKKLLQEN